MRDAWASWSRGWVATAWAVGGVLGSSVGASISPAMAAAGTCAGFALVFFLLTAYGAVNERHGLVRHAVAWTDERPGRLWLNFRHTHEHEPYMLRCVLTDPANNISESEQHIGNAHPGYPTCFQYPHQFPNGRECIPGTYRVAWFARSKPERRWKRIGQGTAVYGQRNAADFE